MSAKYDITTGTAIKISYMDVAFSGGEADVGEFMDLKGYRSATILCDSWSVVGNKINVKVQESDFTDPLTWNDVALEHLILQQDAFDRADPGFVAAITLPFQCFAIGYIGFKRHIRIAYEVDSGPAIPTPFFSVFWLGGVADSSSLPN